MTILNGYEYQKVEGSVRVAGVGELEVVSCQISWSVNAIPMAKVTVPLGRNSESQALSKAKRLRDDLSSRSEAVISLRVDGGTRTVFRGYTTGVANIRTGFEAGVTFNVVHWLSDLSTTSALSESLSPAAMADLSTPAVISMGTGGTSDLHVSLKSIAYSLAQNMGTGDVGDVIIGALQMFASGAQMQNEPAQGAIGKLVQKLKFVFSTTSVINGGIGKHLSAAFRSLYTGGTLWDSLMAITGPLSMCVIPRLDDALIVPYTPVLRTSKYARIKGSDVVYANTSMAGGQPLRGIRLYVTNNLSYTGALAGNSSVPVVVAVRNGVTDGIIDSAVLPEWLNSTYAMGMVLKTYTKGVSGRSSYETEAALAKASERDEVPSGQPSADALTMGRQLAEAMLYERLYNTGSMEIQGRANLDIGPGTQVEIAVPETANALVGDDVARGFVRTVTLSVNAAAPSVIMTYSVSHVRSKSDDRLAPQSHPLYTTALVKSSVIGSSEDYI